MRGTEASTAEAKTALPRGVQVRVGIVGYGTVGKATAEILTSHAEEIRRRTNGVSVVVTRISRKTPRGSETGANGVAIVADWRQVVTAADVDIVVEAVG